MGDNVFKKVTKDTPQSDFIKTNFDASIGPDNKLLDVYYVRGCMHCEGGLYGENCYWTCPNGEVPSHENVREFTGHKCSWGFKCEECNIYIDSGDVVSHAYFGYVYRNGRIFYVIRDSLELMAAKALIAIDKFKTHLIDFSESNYVDKLLGRRIIYRGKECVIKVCSRDDSNGFTITIDVPLEGSVYISPISEEITSWFVD